MATKLYTVQAGESLSKIARDVLGEIERWKELAYINSIEYPYIIKVGQIIKIPDLSAPPLEIVINKGTKEQSAPTANGRFTFSPATVLLLAVGALLLIGKK